METFIQQMMRKKIPERIIDNDKGEKIIKFFNTVFEVDLNFDTINIIGGSYILLTNMRLVLLCGGSIKNDFSLHCADVYCYSIELDNFKNGEIKEVLNASSLDRIVLVLNSGKILTISSDSATLKDFISNFNMAYSEKKSLIRFPEEEHILFKSSLGMNVLPNISPFDIPKNKPSYRNFIFNNALNINLCFTDKRILLYRIEQFDEVTVGNNIRFGKPKLQYITIPYASVSSFKKGKTHLAVLLNQPTYGFELPSTNFYADEDLYFEQTEHECSLCNKKVKGEISEKISALGYENAYNIFLDNKVVAWKCSICGQIFCDKCKSHSGFLTSTIKCPKCNNKQKPQLIKSECYKVGLKNEAIELNQYEPIKKAETGVKGIKSDDFLGYSLIEPVNVSSYLPLCLSRNFNPFFNNILRANNSLHTYLCKIKPGNTEIQIIDIKYADLISTILNENFPDIPIK